jgi:hypothetical protein
VATTDGDDKAATSSEGSPRFSGDEFGSFLRNSVRIRQDINLHGSHFPSWQSWRRGYFVGGSALATPMEHPDLVK